MVCSDHLRVSPLEAYSCRGEGGEQAVTEEKAMQREVEEEVNEEVTFPRIVKYLGLYIKEGVEHVATHIPNCAWCRHQFLVGRGTGRIGEGKRWIRGRPRSFPIASAFLGAEGEIENVEVLAIRDRHAHILCVCGAQKRIAP